MSISPGTRLGPYEILAPLGAGGMGAVYRAKDSRLKREVAVKVLPASFSADADRLRRFELEAEATGQLNHPNILVVYDVGTHDGSPYVVSELLEGETLRARLAHGPLPPRRALEYARAIAIGLAAAHEKGIVHRDLKPENVFVTSDGRIKILDFGLAKLTQPESERGRETDLLTAPQGTEPGVVMGTAGYMSPEQVRGTTVDPRSDLFSFGAILFEMLAGRRAFLGDSAIETMNAILKEEPPDLAGSGRNVPPALDRIVRHCLEKNPAMRFQSARDLAFDLESLSEATSAPAAALPKARAKRSGVYFGAAALLALAAATIAYVAGRGARPVSFPTFQRLTYRAGTLLTGRFAPDGQTIVYTAAWEGKPFQLYSTLPGGAESRPLGLPPAMVTGISRKGMMAIVLAPAGTNILGTLALVPLGGGAPRPILEGARIATWAPDGENLAVVLSGGGGERIEYPIGKVVYRTAGFIYDSRLSPDGSTIAIEETRPLTFQGGTGWIGLVDRSGKRTTLYEGWVRNCGVAWLPGGKEFLFAVPDSTGSYREIYAGSRTGKKRLLGRVAGAFTLYDVSNDGRLLFAREDVRMLTLGGFEGDKTERIISWLDESIAADLSDDGRRVLLSEVGGGGGAKGAVYLRPTDGSDAIRLGDGQGLALSPDGKWALATSNERPELLLYPTGVGQRRTLPVSGFESYQSARWLPDGKRLFFNANVRGRVTRCYLLDLAGGAPRPVGPEGGSCSASSPDGKWLAVNGSDGDLSLLAVDGTATAPPVRGWTKGATVLQWSDDGRSLFLTTETDLPMSIRRLDLQTGRTDLVKTVMPPDTSGVQTIAAPLVTRDGRTYAYTYIRLLGDLYVAQGFK
ncbi:MAG TPA: protein kinase [Thermoanaerobaculia bacterium]|nr:protein kinase [Thermoanaerobaculia bacterium]HEV8609732.1 protein kinase [Thermoanaerobaculia bacterium]